VEYQNLTIMLTCDKVLRKNAVEAERAAQNNEQAITKSGMVVKQGNPWIWFGIAALIAGVGWFFLRKKGSGNEGVSN
jgi:LPXTG-motif cell wall-anchored protein